MKQKLCPLSVLLLLLSAPAIPRERVSRKLDSSDGALNPPVFTLAQDASGFIWIGTVNGLVRYDGSEFRPWGTDALRRDIGLLAAGASGEVFAGEYGGSLFRVPPPDVIGPEDGLPSGGPLLVDHEGSLFWLKNRRVPICC